jgi:hypothetical protein
MGNIYKALLFILFFGFLLELQAQKVIRYRITNVNTNYASNCDGVLNNSDFSFWFTGAPLGTQCDGEAGNNGPINRNPNFDLAGGTYYSRECVPEGTFSYSFRPEEDDDAFFDDQVCNNVSNACTQNHTRTYPAWNAANGNTTVNNNAGMGCNAGCSAAWSGNSAPQNAAIIYRFTSQWQVSGSYDATNLDGNGYINNKICATAYDFGSTSATRTNQTRGCGNEIWYRFTTENHHRVVINSSAGGTVTLYGVNQACAGLTVLATGTNSITHDCPANGTYYFKVSTGSNTDVSITLTKNTGLNTNASTGALTNTTCASAFDLGNNTGTQGGFATQCSNTWYRFENTTNARTLTFAPSVASNITVWYSPNGISCSGHCVVGANGSGSVVVRGAKAGWYYVRINSTGGGSANRNITVSRTTPTSNDDYNFATVVNPSYSGSFNNSSYTNEYNETRPNGMYNTAWYTFTTPAGGLPFLEAKINETTGDNSAVTIYRKTGGDCPFGNLTQQAHNWWCNSSGGSVSINCLPGNTQYYVQYGTAPNSADGVICLFSSESTGGYNIEINSPTPSGRDNLCDAHDFGVLNAGANTGDVYYNNNCMTTQVGEPRLGNMSNTMWYKFTTPATGLVSANIEVQEAGEGANFTAMAIYRRNGACAFGSLTEVGFDRWCGSSGGDITVNCLEPNTEYYIQVGTGFNFALCLPNQSTGRYRVRVTTSSRTAGPDNVCQAQSMGTFANYTSGTISLSTITNHSNQCATIQANEPGGGQKTTWYTFTTGNTVGKDINITVDASDGFDSEVYIYEACGTVCSGLNLNAGVLNELANYWNIAMIPALCIGSWNASGTLSNAIRPNTTYYIRVDGVAACNVDGPYNLSLSMSGGTYIANDNYCAAHNLSSAFNWNSSNVAHTVNTDNASSEDICNTNEPNSSNDQTAWWRFTTGANPPAVITIDPDASGLCTGQAWAYSGAAVGTCSGNSFTNYNASPNNFNGLTEIGSSTLGFGFDINCPTPNTTYYIMGKVGGLCSSGSLTINLQTNQAPVPANNDVCNATNLGTSTFNSTLSSGTDKINNNFCANAVGEAAWVPSFGKDQTVWYRFSTGATVGSNISVQVRNDPASHGDQIASELAVFKRTACNSGTVTLVAEDNPIPIFGNGTEVNFCPEPNTNYWIMVDHDPFFTGAGEGYFDVRVFHNDKVQGPDNICNAVSLGTISGTSGTICLNNQSNRCATLEAGEPSGGQATVWYTFTTGATIGTEVEFNMQAYDGFDADLYVYEACNSPCPGPNFGNLNELLNEWNAILGSAALFIGTWSANAILSNVIKPNTTYWVRADGVSGPLGQERGDFDLCVTAKGSNYIANDNYCGAHNLSSAFNFNTSSISHTVNTSNASSEDRCTTNEPDVSNEQTAWWRFTTGANPPAIISVNPDASGVCTGQAWVYSGAATGPCTGNAFTNYNAGTNNFNGLSLIGSSTLGGDVNIDCPTPNTTYYVMGKVGGLCSSGNLTINLTSNGAPILGNDQCAGAINLGTFTTGGQTLGDASGTNRWNNFCMTNTGDPNPGWTLDPNARKLVWFSFNTGELGRVVDINAITDPGNYGDNIDIKLALYRGSCGSLTYIDRDYDPDLSLGLCVGGSGGLCSEDMPTQYCLDPNTTYYVLVDGSGLNTEGFFGLTVKDGGPYPANDLPCNATVAAVQPFNTYNTTFINNQSNVRGTNCFEPNPGWTSNGNDHGVWYKFNNLPGRRLVIDANNLPGII